MLDDIDQFVSDVVDRYEQDGPGELAPLLVRRRRLVEPLLHGSQRPDHRDRLFRAAARLSGQLSYMATNLGRFASARAYGAEAFTLAGFVEDGDLRAWIRGTQSLAEYYAGRYSLALTLAEDGRRHAGRGPQSVRLAVNGESRALSKLGQRRAAERAIAEAYEALDRFSPEPGMSPCNSFGLYSEARTAANAATAHVTLDQPRQAMSYATQSLEVVNASSSAWSRALVRLDMAAAVMAAPQPDLEHAAALTRDAMAAADPHPIESIRQRTRAAAQEFTAWPSHPAAREIINEIRQWFTPGPDAHDR